MANFSAINTLLNVRIAEAAAWCEARMGLSLDPQLSLRSEELRPEGDFFANSGSHLIGKEFANWYRKQDEKNAILVESIAKRRSALLLSTLRFSGKSFPRSDGKLLIYIPFYSSGDTLASGDSAGFFDADDSPPWDTFIFYFSHPNPERSSLTEDVPKTDEGVLCWIPQEYWNLAEAGIRCNPCGSLKWFDEKKARVGD